VHGANGTAANPSFAFLSNQNTGLYRIGLDNIGVAANGAKVLDIATTGLGITGTATISSSIAASAGAGALVVTGGISAGNNGNASYFGGAVTIATTAATPFLVNSTSANPTIVFQVASGNSGIVGVASATNAVITGSTLGDLVIRTAGNILFTTDAGTSVAMKLAASTGAATFAGAVSVGGALKLGNGYVGTPVVGTGYIVIQDSNGTNYKVSVAAL